MKSNGNKLKLRQLQTLIHLFPFAITFTCSTKFNVFGKQTTVHIYLGALKIELGCNIHPLMQDSYNFNVTIFNQCLHKC